MQNSLLCNGNYALTSAGEIYRLTINGSSRKLRKNGPKRIKALKHPHKYLVVNLYDEGRHYYRYIHKLVAEAFLPPAPSPDHVVHHLDEDSRNNDYRNLEWMLSIEHIIHHVSKLTADDVRMIRKLAAEKSYRELMKQFGVSRTAVYKIVKRESWKHVE